MCEPAIVWTNLGPNVIVCLLRKKACIGIKILKQKALLNNFFLLDYNIMVSKANYSAGLNPSSPNVLNPSFVKENPQRLPP